jgi:hypothetical protein
MQGGRREKCSEDLAVIPRLRFGLVFESCRALYLKDGYRLGQTVESRSMTADRCKSSNRLASASSCACTKLFRTGWRDCDRATTAESNSKLRTPPSGTAARESEAAGDFLSNRPRLYCGSDASNSDTAIEAVDWTCPGTATTSSAMIIAHQSLPPRSASRRLSCPSATLTR